ncbi:peptidase domain-containing ABC transporter [Flavobacterium aquidurense]|nr:peptidase domain-containing ABC transporter [Flavobacterium aquidurense]
MKFTAQHDQMDCGPACISMVASFHGKNYPLEYLRKNAYVTREGVSVLGISEASRQIGFETLSVQTTTEKLIKNKQIIPFILYWNQRHFVVLYKITKSLFSREQIFHIADPKHGKIKITQEKLEKSWLSDRAQGVAIFLNPTEKFYQKEAPKEDKLNIRYLFFYLIPYKKQLVIMFLLLLIGCGLTLFLPFLTEALIDEGVNNKDLNFISLILLAQLSLFIGSLTIGIFRNWLLLYIGTHLSITIVSDFLKKMLRLPIKFFDTKLMGDFQQRIQDNDRIEEFLTSQSLTTFFSIITFSVFFTILWYYDIKILLVYFLFTTLSIIWSFYWLKKRRILDYFRFQQRSENQESIFEMLNGITEMKLNQLENFKIKEWEKIQKKLFKLNSKILKLDQIQLSGFDFINQLKNILVTFLAATYVVQDTMTLGMLLSISYIIGQMNAPVNQLISFFRSMQDAKLSLERLNEVQNNKPEEVNEQIRLLDNIRNKKNCPENGISFKNLSFQYEGPKSPFVLKDINLFIPEGKITAIVGASGSGKTTLIKLLLRFYDPIDGEIFYNKDNILTISPKSIRENTGVVMQDGFIFSDTIQRNIATKDKKINKTQLKKAVKTANIKNFMESLPLKYNTKIGSAGSGLSGGEKQRILIARAVYKNPHYIFFDEATSALDSENEKIIHDNLQEFFKDKTVIIIAHRLSTVKNADNIVVLKKGKIAETGNHNQLVKNKADYFNLIKNQLELGN